MHKTNLGHFSSDQVYISRGKFWFETEKLLDDPSAEPKIMMSAYLSGGMIPVTLIVDITHNKLIWSSSGEVANVANKYEIVEYVKNLISNISCKMTM